MKKSIIIVGGDPNSINSEIIFKSWKKISKNIKNRIFLISNYKLIKAQFKKLKYPINMKIVKNLNEISRDGKLKIINLDLKFKNPFKVPKKPASNFVINSLNLAHKLALNENVTGIINCAISKNLLNKKDIGVTEFFSSKCKIKKNSEVMLIQNSKFSVSPITTHLDVKQISKNIKKDVIISKVITLNNWFKKTFKKKPRVGILGLNPHNAELRKNSEEITKIIPAINKLKNLKININGPLVADTVFVDEYKSYDVIFGMYHDQILPAFKTIFKFDAINVTIGLNYLRVSPDHGTAKYLIGKNRANIKSFLNCIKFINRFGK